jgi:hypothetical protein
VLSINMTPSYSQLSANAIEGYAMYICKNMHKEPTKTNLIIQNTHFAWNNGLPISMTIYMIYGSVGNRKYEKQHIRTMN